MTAKDLFELKELLLVIRKEFAEDRERWMNSESESLRKAFEKDAERRGIQCGNLDYYIRVISDRLDAIEI